METALIDFYGVQLYCEFEYLPGSFEEPEDTSVRTARAGAIDILSILNDEQIGELETLCLERYREERDRQHETQRSQWRMQRIASIRTPFDGSAATR